MNWSRFLLVLSFTVFSPALISQTLYVPGGTSGVGSSASNVGVGTTSTDKLFTLYGSDISNQIGGSLTGLRIINSNAGAAGRVTEIAFGGRSESKKPFAAISAILAADSLFEQSGDLTFSTKDVTTATYPIERMRIMGSGNVGIGTTAPAAKLDVFSGGSMTAGGYNGQLATLQVGYTGGAAANADGATIVLSQQYSSGDPASIVRVGTIVGYKGQADGSFGGGMKFRVQPVGANPLLDVMTLAMSGNVGIGTPAPATKLHAFGIDDNVNGQVRVESSGSDARISLYNANGATSTGRGDILMSRSSGYEGLRFMINNADKMIIDETGNVGIGTTNPTQKLAVNGTIRAKEVIVDTGWSDYVFKPNYHLESLSDVEAHIKAHGTLPGVPSEAEVAKEGIGVGEMQAKLLAKIEELTLHQIELSKENEALRSRVTALEATRRP